MDKLDRIFELQAKFDAQIASTRNVPEYTVEQWVQKEILAMVAELAEVLEEVNYKWWKNPKEVNMDNLKEEMIDVLHFYISTCLKLGMTPDELLSVYESKNKENHDRQKGLSSKAGYALSEIKTTGEAQ